MGYRILFMDDNKQHVKVLEEACTEAGHELLERDSVAAAMLWLNTKDHIDVIVSNAFLERESVFDFLRKVKRDPRHKWVQFVMICTAPSDLALFVSDSVERAAELLGADKYVMMHEFCPYRLLKEIEASLPNRPPQKNEDPVRDKLGIPRPTDQMPNDVTDAQRPKQERPGRGA